MNIKEKAKLKKILLIFAIMLGFILCSSAFSQVKAATLNTFVSKFDSDSGAYSMNTASYVGKSYSIGSRWGNLGCIQHVSTVRGNWTVVGGVDINLNGDGKMYMYTSSGKTEITNTNARNWLWATAYYAKQATGNAYDGDNPSEPMNRVALAFKKALSNISGSTRIKNAFGTYPGTNVAVNNSKYAGQYKAKLIVFSGGGSQNLMAVRGTKLSNIQLRIVKTDGTRKLQGAKFRIYNIDRKKYVNTSGEDTTATETDGIFTTDENGLTKQITVPAGRYVAKEIQAPKGYNMIVGDITLIPNRNTEIINKPTGQIIICKRKPNWDGLDGASFDLYKVNANGTKTLVRSNITTAGGVAYVTGLSFGKYEIKETQAPAGYVMSTETQTCEISESQLSCEVSFVNYPQPETPNGQITICKRKPNWDGLDGASFDLYKVNGDGTKTLVKSNITTTGGVAYVTGLSLGKYEIKETKAPSGYVMSTETQTCEISESQLSCEVSFVNYPEPRATLTIVKVDKDTGMLLSGAGFMFKNTTEGKWLSENSQGEYILVDSFLDASEFTTDSSGKITLSNLKDGSWIAYEKQAPSGYKLLTGYVELKNNQTTYVYNEKEYVNIEGFVFVDGHQGKTSLLNNMYDEGEGIDGVKVTLKLDGQVVANVASGYSSTGAKCDKNGKYIFYGKQLKIEANNLKQYTIEFEYNGLKYENVAIQPQIVAGASSKAKEKQSEREAFNTRYSTVTANTKIANGQSTNKSKGGDIIRYTSQSYTSKIMYQTSSKDDKGNAYGNEVYADDQYHIKSYTTEAGLDLSKQTYPYDPSKDTIVDINFGIYEREHPDVAISSDLAVAETSINGYTQIYPYQKRYDQIENDSAFTVEVKASDLTYNSSYQRKLYKSDVQYTQVTNDGSELAVYLTYKVAIKNQSSSINVTVNDIVDYFSKDLTVGIVAIGTNARELSEIPAKTNGNRYQLTNTNGMQYSNITDDSGYSKQYITLNKEIKTGEKYQFYVQYKMSIEAIRKTLAQDVKFNNVFELNTVSAKTKNGEIYTAVDMDSAVGNCVPSDKRTMEDDTDYAPGIDIITRDQFVRQITGIVFEDQTPEEFLTGQERKGNGQYDSGEKGVPNATVQLVDIDRGGKVAYSNMSGTDIKSEENGNYTIKGFIPGNYIIKYTYGNGTEKYTAQQYKSTIYVDQARANTNYANGYHNGVSTGNKYWYKDETNRKSDAIDNYNGEIKTLYDMSQAIINMSRTEIEKIWNQADGMQHILNGTNVDNTIKIDAFTPHVGMPVEKEGAREGEYVVANIDFGVVERARYQVKMEKTIARIKLIKPDGSILREFSDFNNPPANTSVMKSTETERNGFVHFSIDAELLQATTLLVDYGFKATNTSEIEYIDETYYKYGIVPLDKENKKVKLSIVNVIDYVDNQLQYLEDNSTLTNGKTNKLNGWSTIDLNAEENKKYVSEDVRKSLYKDGKCEFSTILIGKGLDGEMLKSGENQSTVLTLNKILTTSQDEMSYENMVEVVEVKKTWGRELYMEDTTNSYGQKLGNLDPVNEIGTRKTRDPDTGYSEKIIIANPEGGNRNYTIYVISGIVSAIILAIGIVLIKKKAL